MSEVSLWVISIAGICLISVLIDLILPNGKTNFVIRSVFAFVIVFVVLMPLPKLVNGEFDINGVFSNYQFQIQEDYIYNMNQAKLEKWTNEITKRIEDVGIYGVTISISANIFESNMEISAIYVDLYNVVISENLKNKNIKMEVINIIDELINVDEDKVIFYE